MPEGPSAAVITATRLAQDTRDRPVWFDPPISVTLCVTRVAHRDDADPRHCSYYLCGRTSNATALRSSSSNVRNASSRRSRSSATFSPKNP